MSIPGNPAELCQVLDGVAERRLFGYDAITDERVLHVPHAKAHDEAAALLICRRTGLLRDKLAAMEPTLAAIVYLTAITEPNTED
jgi:hypothetical protein